MSLIVQKFGGTSVADSTKILAAARKAIRAQQNGSQVVMVVSAMGHNTDMLVELARELTDHPPAREMDMLLSTGEQVSVALMAMAIDSLGYQAISMTGAQIGIKTDSTHTKARIHSISTERMRKALDEGKIVIAAGFQGIDEHHNITTLGRGGSDTTAVALAAVLGADACEIYTDVDGVYTTDPRALPEARMVKQVSYDEMLELASLGAGVMHSRSIEFAKKFSVPIHVRNSFADIPGTMIVTEPEAPGQAVSGATLVKNEARVTVLGVPDRPGASLTIFSKIAAKNISVDMIVQNIGADAKADVSFTVFRDDLPATLQAVVEAAEELGAEGFTQDENVSKVSVVGLGMATQTGVAQKMFRALAENNVNILMITTSEIKISVLVSRDQGAPALRTVHRVFELDKEPPGGSPFAPRKDALSRSERRPSGDATAVVARLQGMEDLAVSDIALDDSQARVTIANVPDAPGLAAQVFEQIAEGGILVDMIVQSFGRDGRANLSFTVPQTALDKAVKLSKQLAASLGCGPVTSCPRVAKLSVSGIGMRSHTGVAIRMFRALADAGINLDMINTSEVRVNVVVDGAAGPEALKCLQAAFADAQG
ncbi:MAG TPA: aspartate kinase [Pirellulales bacterium]|jgi:aspartate kinase|nr:aspartate kinase [Pirellulales bacterium]